MREPLKRVLRADIVDCRAESVRPGLHPARGYVTVRRGAIEMVGYASIDYPGCPAVVTLTGIRRQDPDTVTFDWTELLRPAGLEPEV